MAALSPLRQERRDAALDALALIRRERLSLSQAARKAGTTPKTVRKYTGSALRRSPSGRYVPRRRDSLYRRMWITSTEGAIWVAVWKKAFLRPGLPSWDDVRVAMLPTGWVDNKILSFGDRPRMLTARNQ